MMKKSILSTLLAMGLLLFCLPSFAQLIPANLYNCTGTNFFVSYSTSSFSGEPLLNITLGTKQVSKKGKEIEVQPTILGDLVSIVTAVVPDLYTDSVAVLLPNVNISALGEKASFSTRIISSHSRTSIGGTSLVKGVIQKNTSSSINCTATAVVF